MLSDNNLYKGFISNLTNRIKDHKRGKVKSTRNKRPLKLIHYEVYFLKSDVLRREKFFKTTKGRRLLRQQIRDILKKNNYSTCTRSSTG